MKDINRKTVFCYAGPVNHYNEYLTKLLKQISKKKQCN